MKNSLIFFLLLLSSCGYHLGRTKNLDKIYISVPYVKDDFSGLFTNALIKEVSFSPNMKYKYNNSDFILSVKIIQDTTKQIGYKYDRDNQNRRRKNIRATEGRQIITAQVELIEKSTNIAKFGPLSVSASAEFDYVDEDSLNDLSFIDPNDQRTTVLAYSLGQLESIENAKEATLHPLYERLAKKIVDAISAYW